MIELYTQLMAQPSDFKRVQEKYLSSTGGLAEYLLDHTSAPATPAEMAALLAAINPIWTRLTKESELCTNLINAAKGGEEF